IGQQDTGIHLRVDGDRLVVDQVTPYSLAAIDRVVPGSIVLHLNGTHVFWLPAYIYPEPSPTDDPNVQQQPIGVEPSQPTAVSMPAEQLQALANAAVDLTDTINPPALAGGSPDSWFPRQFWYYGWNWEATLVPLAV